MKATTINRSLHIASPGVFSTLEFQPAPRRMPEKGEIEVEVFAAGLNFKDVLIALGMIGADAASGPLGSEFAGRVSGVGQGVDEFRTGDAVMGVGSACVAAYVTVPVQKAVCIPAGLTFTEASGLPAAYLTAHFALECARLSAGETILIHAASGGVGLASVMLAKAVGAEIFATAGNDEKRAYLRSQGIRWISDSRSFSFVEEVRAETRGRGVDVAINSLAGDFARRTFELLAPHGRFIELGVRDILDNRALALGGCMSGASYIAIGAGAGFPKTGERLREIAARIEKHELPLLPYRCFAAEEAAPAFEFMARARHIGKIVLAIRPEEAGRRVGGSKTIAVAAGHENYLLPSQGVDVFRRVLASGLAQVAVSTVELRPRIECRIEKSAPPKLSGVSTHARPHLRTPYVAPQNAIQEALAGHWQEFLGIDRIGVDDDFFNLGGDSLLAVQLLAAIRSAMGVDLPAHVMAEATTIAKLADRFPAQNQTNMRSELPRCLVRLKDGSPGVLPLFLFHPVGGQVYLYRDLVNLLDDRIPVWGIQADDYALAGNLERMANHYLAAVRVIQPAGAYQLGGSSFGGALAYECAQQLEAQGEQVRLLAMLDTPAPHQAPEGSQDDIEILLYLLGLQGTDRETFERLARLPIEEQLRHFVGRGGEAGRRAAALTAGQLREFLRLWKINIRALRDYQPKTWHGPGVFFRATVADGVNGTDYHSGWKSLAPAIQFHNIEGTHIGINLPPLVQLVADILAPILDCEEKGKSQ